MLFKFLKIDALCSMPVTSQNPSYSLLTRPELTFPFTCQFAHLIDSVHSNCIQLSHCFICECLRFGFSLDGPLSVGIIIIKVRVTVTHVSSVSFVMSRSLLSPVGRSPVTFQTLKRTISATKSANNIFLRPNCHP